MRAAAPTISDPPVNTPTSARPVKEQEGQVLGGVPGRGQRAQGQPAEVDLVAVAEADMVEVPVTGGRGQDRRVVVGVQLPGAGQEVGVQVGVGGVRDPQTTSGGSAADRAQVPRRVHRQRPTVAEVEQVGAVAQALVHHRDQPICIHQGSLCPKRWPQRATCPTLFHRTLEDAGNG